MSKLDLSKTHTSLPEQPGLFDIFKTDKNLKPTGSVRSEEKAGIHAPDVQQPKKRNVVLRKHEPSPATPPWELVEVSSGVFKIKLYGEYVNKGKDEDVLYVDPDVKEKDADDWIVNPVHEDPRPFARIIRSAVTPGLSWAASRVDEKVILKTFQPDAEEFIFAMQPTPKHES